MIYADFLGSRSPRSEEQGWPRLGGEGALRSLQGGVVTAGWAQAPVVTRP